jgi:lipopolysaccharide transport system ATP-binding protein
MTRREVQRKLADIVAFAEVERFLDTPVKRYSSGMYVRLAFAVAAHLEPEILLIDEVLAVGDAGFQKRCLGRMQDISRAGRTIVFVSHNMAAVTGLCTRALHLDRGQLAADGSPAEVVASYLGQHAAETLETVFDEASGVATEWLALHRVGVCRADGAAGPLTVRTPLRIETEFSTLQPHRSPNLSLLLYNAEGTCLFNAASPLMEVPAGRHVAAVEIPGDLLNNGLHRVRVLLGVDFIPQVDRDDALQFTVQDSERTIPVFVDWIGAVRPALPWTWRTVAPPWTGGQTSGLPLPRDAGLVLTTTASLTADPSGMPREPQR